MYKITEFLNVTEAAEFLGVSVNTLFNWQKKKKIRVYRNPINNYRLYKKEDLLDILASIKIDK